MGKKLGFIKRFVLLGTSVVTSSVVAALPSQAATLSSSIGLANFINFNLVPFEISSLTNTKTLVLTELGSTIALAEADANFTVSPSVSAYLNSTNISNGEGEQYLGLAQTQSQIIGNFLVAANEYFYFDFNAFFNLEASITNPNLESAYANASIFLLLVDTSNQTVYDFFGIFSNLTTQKDRDFLELQSSEAIQLTEIDNSSQNILGLQKSLQISVAGSLQRFFTSPTELTLLAVTSNEACVEAPQIPQRCVQASEPSNTLALMFFLSFTGIGCIVGKTFVNRVKIME